MAEWYRNFAAHIRGEPDEIIAIERMIVRLINEHNLSRDEAIQRIFLAGIDHLLTEPTMDDPVIRRSRVIARQVEELTAQKTDSQRLTYIYEQLGLDAFVTWCTEQGIDPQPTIQQYSVATDSFTPQRQSWTESTLVWLRRMLSDGQSHAVEEILQAAARDGILPDILVDEAGYKRSESSLRAIASMHHFSGGKRGQWQLPNNQEVSSERK